jgi:predicted NAD/FAD-binding protein
VIIEKSSSLGGDIRSVRLGDGGEATVDCGFMIFNEPGYPEFTSMLRELEIKTLPVRMGLSVAGNVDALLNTNLPIRSALVNWRHSPQMYADYRALSKCWRAVATGRLEDGITTIADRATQLGVSTMFYSSFLQPMIATMWNITSEKAIAQMPEQLVALGMHQQGFLLGDEHPVWRRIADGACSYVERLRAAIMPEVVLNAQVTRLSYAEGKGVVAIVDGSEVFADGAVVAVPAFEAARVLNAPLSVWLNRFSYKEHLAVLHTSSVLLKGHLAGGSTWNYTLGDDGSIAITYYLPRLGDSSGMHLLTITDASSEPASDALVLESFKYQHLLPRPSQLEAVRQLTSFNEESDGRIQLAGAYFGRGFHEDAVRHGRLAGTRVAQKGSVESR